jgi:hypothetical protein
LLRRARRLRPRHPHLHPRRLRRRALHPAVPSYAAPGALATKKPRGRRAGGDRPRATGRQRVVERNLS